LTTEIIGGTLGGSKRSKKVGTPMPLTDVFLKSLKPPDKPTKYRDGGGMYLYATSTGLKSWRFNYRFGGNTKL
jgi:hypothetical protein